MPEDGEPKENAETPPDASGAAPGCPETPQAFISYSSADSSVANAICHSLERAGVRCWIAPRDVTPGDFYASSIVNAIDTARVLVLVLSQHSIASAHVIREVERASSKRCSVLTFRIDQAPLPSGLEYFLNTSQWLDASATGANRALPRLVDAVKNAVGKQPAAPGKRAVSARSASFPWRLVVLGLAAAVAIALAYGLVDKLWLSQRGITANGSVGAAVDVPATVSAKAIAVMPFLNLSSDKEQEYFSDGLSEELLNLLAKIPELRVAARTSSFSFKGKDVKLTDVARELQVAHVLEGSVRKSGDRVRITAQLIRASDGYHQWSETYDRTLDDVFAVQEEIAAAVVSELKLKLLSAPTVAQTKPEAYALYLQASQQFRQNTGTADEIISLYKQVLEIDPNYAPASVGLARMYIGTALIGARPLTESMEEARALFNKALALDPEYAGGDAGLGWLAMHYDHDLAAAAKHFERALMLAPSDIDVLILAANLSWALGRGDTLDVAEYIVSRDPLTPGNYVYLGQVHHLGGRLDEAIAAYRLALKLSPGMDAVHGVLGESLMRKGEYTAALTEYEKEPITGFRLAGLASAYHSLGRAAESDAALAELTAKHPDWPTHIAIVHAHRGENDRAFAWLEKAVEIRDIPTCCLGLRPDLAVLHKDPRWLPLLRRIGRAPEQLAAIKFEMRVPTP